MTRDPLEILRVVTGTPQLADVKQLSGIGAPSFDVFIANLPLPKFRGFPSQWHFAVLNRHHVAAAPEDAFREIATLTELLKPTEPLAVLNDNSKITIAESLKQLSRRVFVLEGADIWPGKPRDLEARFTPLVESVKAHKLDTSFATAFSPYPGRHPINNPWQFFGRRKELDQLMESNENFAIIGGRRCGKTSILQELTRRLKERGDFTLYIDVQNVPAARIKVQLLEALSARDYISVLRRKAAFGEDLLDNVIERLIREHRKVTLVLDELGIVIASTKEEDWSFIGTLRKFSNTPGLRLIFSAFQELIIRQESDPEGPLVNLARTMRLGAFSENEIEELVTMPLEFFKQLPDRTRRSLREVAIRSVGRHPLFLQVFCNELFKRAILGGEDPAAVAQAIASGDRMLDVFVAAVDEVFGRLASPMLKYVFLTYCLEMQTKREALHGAVIDDEWLERMLDNRGWQSTVDGRRRILEGLEIYGLTLSVNYNHARQQMAAPVIFNFLSQNEPNLKRVARQYGIDAERELDLWLLEPRTHAV